MNHSFLFAGRDRRRSRPVGRAPVGRALAATSAVLLLGVVAASPASADVPTAPSRPTVQPGNAQITVSFTPPSDGGSPITEYDTTCVSSDGGLAGLASDTASPILVGGVSNGKTYTCSVIATNADGPSPPSPGSLAVVPSTVPDTPAPPTAEPGNAQITVSFVAPFDGGSDITAFGATCTSFDGGAPGSASGTASPLVVGGLTNGNTYTCTVKATNANGAGAASDPSDEVIPSTVPSAPVQPTVTAGNAQITVSVLPAFDGGSEITEYDAACTSSDGGASGAASGASLQLVVGALSNGKTYRCTMTATNANGTGPSSPVSAAVVPNSVPDAPTKPTALPGNAQISVSFVAPFNGGSPITGYHANCTSSDGGVSGAGTGAGSPILVGGLTNGKTYTCVVVATNTNGDGGASVASAAVVPSTVPSAPAQPTTSAGNAQISVFFTAPANGGSAITGFGAACVSSNGGAAGSVTGPVSPIAVGGLTNGKAYTCTVTASNANGTGLASPPSAIAIPSTVPSAPASPTVQAGNGQVTVSFVAPGDGGSSITNYSAACVSSNGGTAGSAGAAGSPIVVGGLTNGKSYTCTVTATNANGDGPASPVSASVIPSAIPSPPAQPTVTAGNGQISVSFVAPFDGGSPITSFGAACTSSNGGAAGSATGAGSPIVVGALTNGSSYTCTVTATNANGTSPASPASAVTIPNRVPDAPAQPTVVPGNAQITVSFVAPFNGGSAITGYRANCTSSDGGAAGTATATVSPIVVGALTNGKTYTCTVTATNANGDGAASPASAVVVPSTVPSAPAQPAVTPGNAQISVAFGAPFNGGSAITSFGVACTSSNGGVAGSASGTVSPIVVGALTNGSSYTCTVTATNANGTSPASPASAVTIPNRVPDAPAQPTAAPGNAQVTVSFAAPFNGGSPITGYHANCTSSDGGAAGAATGTVSPIVVGTLTNGKTYTCTVTATNANGDGAASAASAAVVPSTIPSAPVQPTLAAGNAQLTVSFAAPSNGGSAITRYDASCTSSNGGATGSGSATVSPIVVGGLSNGKSYTCTVTATNANGTGAASPASLAAIPSTVPSAPAQPTIGAGNALITVSFVAPGDGGSAITNFGAACVSSNGGTAGSATGAGSPIVVGGLSNGKSYTCTVTATNANGTGAASPASAAAVPSTIPSAPAQPTAGAGNGQVSVVFVAPFDGGSPITGYAAACVSSNGGASNSATGAGSPIIVTGLTNGKTYTCTVTATNAHGTSPASPASGVVVPNRVPDPPTQPTVGAGNAQLTVSFVAPFDGGSPITGYSATCVSSNGGTVGAATGAGSPIVVGGLSNGKSYTCVVIATNANGAGAQSPASAVAIPSTVPSAPAAPTVAAGNAQITVSFVAPFDGGSGITNYGVSCTSSNGGAAGSAGGAASPVVVGGLSNGKSYTCTVTATNANGTGLASPASAAAVPSTIPSPPAQPTVAPGNAQITVSFVAPFNGGSAITRYDATCTSSNGGVSGIASLNLSPLVVSNLTNGKSYTCTLTATNANGTSAASPASAAVIPSTVPNAPAEPTIAVGNGQLTVSFVAPFDGGSAITRYDATCTSSNGGVPSTNSATGSPIMVGSLSNAKSYTCTVTATNANGTSPPSPASEPAVPSTVPTAPQQPTAGVGNGQLTVAFVAPFNGGSPITGFAAACASSDGGTAGSASGTASPILVTGLTNGKSYTCTVTATNANGTSAQSVPSAVAIPNRVPDAPAQPTAVAGNARATVSFVAPFDGGSSITGYGVACTSSNGGIARTVSGGTSPVVVTGLANGKSYQCTVNATNANGTGVASAPSAALVPSTVPSVPAAPRVTAGNAQLMVAFTAPFNGGRAITGYTATCVSTNGGKTAHRSGPRSPLAVTGVTNSRTYRCSVGASNANGAGAGSALSGTVVPVDPVVVLRKKGAHGFRLFSGDGRVFTFGNAGNYGSAAGKSRLPVVGMTSTVGNRGYWLVATDGGIFSFGDAHFYGSTGNIRLTRPIVGMAATPTGRGYWLVASDGGIFSFGDARFFGSTGAIRLNSPIVGMAATPSGRGYWMVAADGGMFSFGDAHFYGSAAAPGRRIVGMATTATGHGYWIAAANGAVFAYGDAPRRGGAPAAALRLPIAGIASTPTGNGYWLAAGDGGLFAFGDAQYIPWSAPIVLTRPIQGVSR